MNDPYEHSVSLRIQSECGKLRTRKTLNTDTFHAVGMKVVNKNIFKVIAMKGLEQKLKLSDVSNKLFFKFYQIQHITPGAAL